MNKPRLLFIAAFGFLVAGWETIESIHLIGALGSPVVEGDVISREPFKRFGGRDASRLRIRISGTNTIVIAETNRPDLKDLPDHVRFRYTGDPSREVFVWGEENPIWVALFLYPVCGIILLICLVPRGPAGEKAGPSERSLPHESTAS